MKKKARLNIDIDRAIAELQSVVEEFKLKQEIYKLAFRGKGLDFYGYRIYSPDDDASNIDWKASVRSQKLLVKQYEEERDLNIMFLVDVGTNMVFGSTEKIKCEYVAEFAGAFGNVILNSYDKVGFILFNNSVKSFVECKGGTKQFQLFIESLSDSSNYGGETNINGALEFALTYLDDSISSVVIISDFLKVDDETGKKLSLLSSRFETIAIRVNDPLDISLPDIGKEIVLEGVSNQNQIMINPKIAKRSYERYSLEQRNMVEAIFKKSQIDYLSLTTDKSFAFPFAMFLKHRLGKKF